MRESGIILAAASLLAALLVTGCGRTTGVPPRIAAAAQPTAAPAPAIIAFGDDAALVEWSDPDATVFIRLPGKDKQRVDSAQPNSLGFRIDGLSVLIFDLDSRLVTDQVQGSR